jgi:hypothetical protein
MNLEWPKARSWVWLPALAPTCVALFTLPLAMVAAEAIPAPGTKLPPVTNDRVITAADVTVERVGTSIPASAIGEPVGGVTLASPRWLEATENSVAYALVEGAVAPKDPKGKPNHVSEPA